MNIFTLLLLFVCIAFGVSDRQDEHGHHENPHCHLDDHDDHDDHDRHHDDHDDHHDDHHDHGVPKSMTEGCIIRKLLARHAKDGRPNSGSGPVEVGIGLFVEALTEVNEEEGYVEISGFLSIQWIDPRLRFNYGKPFNEVHDVRLARNEVWLPDIELYNQVSHGMEIMNSAEYQVVVEYNGTVKWYPTISARASCSGLNNHSEEIRCGFKFGSWTYSDAHVNLQIMQSMPTLSQYKKSGHWIATNAFTKRSAVTYPCCPESYVDVTFVLTLKRTHD